MGFLNWLWILVLIAGFLPVLKHKWLEISRQRVIRRLEQKRGSRLVTLLHRQEVLSLLGIPISRFIDIEDSEQVLRAIRMTPENMPIDIILHTPGGLVLAAEQIARALIRHRAPVTIFIPHYAMSGGTLIALAADEIVMDENAVLGPIDPQLGQYPATSILKVIEQKDINEIDDETLILADVAKKAIRQTKGTLIDILSGNGMEKGKAEELTETLTSGRWTHDYPITVEEARRLGLPVRGEMPEEVYTLMSLYPQPTRRQPSVQYIPVPYRKKRKPSAGK
ncbi:MAG: hypothetical protein U9R11_01610 [Chloroflexota bacterium]|nr:hypothetical protein [Chloroflexota bacterium]